MGKDIISTGISNTQLYLPDYQEVTDNKLKALLVSCGCYAKFRLECMLKNLPLLLTKDEFDKMRAEYLNTFEGQWHKAKTNNDFHDLTADELACL